MSVHTFNSFDELLHHLQEDQKVADERAGNRGKLFQPGSHFVRLAPEIGVVIYGEVLDPVASEKAAGASENEVEFMRSIYSEPHMRNTRFSRCFSTVVPDGELGNTHVASMNLPLNKTEFERARKLGWPSSIEGLMSVLNVKLTNRRVAEA